MALTNNEETKYTVTYTDGVDGEEVFADQVYGNLLSEWLHLHLKEHRQEKDMSSKAGIRPVVCNSNRKCDLCSNVGRR